ncbi:hypothetical protein L210DRAFT_2540443 [Boletus edulis BED1]|uniref:Uncharacterized protein n=1 Tax=Boletus edulis BED1 TaxID=1328754 RepID=A0AAD4BMX2_BOLED|nr:hypothetical protein L210DRAFT_2540443 [Boletus edulis BED1]
MRSLLFSQTSSYKVRLARSCGNRVRRMQEPSQAEPKSSPLITSPHSYRRLCPWLPVDHDHIHEVQLDYQRQIVRLMFAQALVLYGSSAIHLLPDDCQASFRFIPASRALSLAGLLIQLVFYRGVPSHIPKAFLLVRTEESRSRAILFFASLWLPFVPFVLSIILLCFASRQ